MDATERGANSGMSFNKINAAIQLATAHNKMIEQARDIWSPLSRSPHKRPGNRCGGRNAEKASPRNLLSKSHKLQRLIVLAFLSAYVGQQTTLVADRSRIENQNTENDGMHFRFPSFSNQALLCRG
jgi:hypothetical protein